MNTLTPAHLAVLWNALQQYVDNNDPDECDGDPRITRIAADHALASEMLAALDAHFIPTL